MEIVIKTFAELSLEELYGLLRLRSEVFVVEQDCVYQDVDNKDQKALHVIGKIDNKIVAYTRLFKPGYYFERSSIGRVVVSSDYRGMNLGHKILTASIEAVNSFFKVKDIEISAQTYLMKFYSEHSFETIGEEYLEDGIPHIRMIRH
ncbi:GNAT family N-acetyltransferase [Robertkochia solimangrovi]|uniref:GNAT family N-acetyltransferase n=1 Tax=Robertkochia solimangrovi TaxID=2213046 RepID=UPI00117E3BB2|nr:GNAT family N-acetyltransferase [Robertkochia solimangrovi]TRZ46070.1 GNAT family N-acetyltransferase [Robertkochia solimangrovi]